MITTKNRVAAMLRNNKMRRRVLVAFACLALVVYLGVNHILTLKGLALSETVAATELVDETAAGTTASDEAVVTDAGAVTTPVDEGTTESALGTASAEENNPDVDAYNEDAHNEDAHKQDALDETIDEATDESATTVEGEKPELSETETVSDMPAQTFTGELRDGDVVTVKVDVDAPEGALPTGTTMHVSPVDDAGVSSAVTAAVENQDEGKVTDMLSVDIVFRDAEGNQIEPAKELTVKLTSDLIAQNDTPYVVHVDEHGEADVVDTLNKETLKERDLSDEADQLVFDAQSFSPYSIVVTSKEETLSTEGGETFQNITLDAKASAGVPAGAELRVSEILPGTDEYAAYLSQLQDETNATADFARFFDISIIKDGEEIQPQDAVDVKIQLNDADDLSDDVHAVHFAQDGPEVIDASLDGEMVEFEANGFSVYGIVSSGETTGLNGKSFAIINAYTNNALQAQKLNDKKLVAEQVVLQENYVSANDDIASWTFRSAGGNKYYIQSADGQYLHIDGNNSNGSVTLSSNPQALTVTAGTNGHASQVRITNNNSGVAINNYSGSTASGFGTYNDQGNNEWFTLYELEDIVLNPAFAAEKISVQNIQDAQQVVIYRSVYNETSGKYEDYVIDGNGELVKAYDKGDQVVGRSAVSTAWTVIMHRDETTHELNGYYDFYNVETGKYLSPASDGTLVASTMPGVTLNGRRDGAYTSTIEAWDSSAWAWYGYQIIKDENGDVSLASGTGSDSRVFSFAAYVSETTDELHEVATVDSAAAGITIKMYDFGSRSQITNVVGGDTYREGNYYNNSGQASKTLVNGYPYFQSTGKNASELFNSANYKGDANHLFLDSVYNSTGYYEYSCFNNYAYYHNGDFKVYQETGTPSNDNKFFYKRGNFLPYNSLDVTRKATNVNLYDGSGEALSPLDPTQGDTLYLTKNTDFWFGMTMEATFMQPRDGQDKNGPVVYEFNGDDDLWIYIDGVLVLDIGGVHDALPGTINFATGEIHYDDTRLDTTIRACFKAAGVFPDGSRWDDAKADQYFKGNTFADYGSHSFKMFYMEHGAGASNLEMRFNLPVIEKGKFTVEKQLDGTTQQKYANVPFAYQAFEKRDGGDVPLTSAVYEGMQTPVRFYDGVTIGGKDYDNVFYLKPGEAATFAEMEENSEYYVREIGVGTDYYDSVVVNDVKIDGQEVNAEDGIYPTAVATVASRARVAFSNHCSDKNLNDLRITKKLVDGCVSDGSTFEFRVLLEGADGTLVPYSTADYYIQNDAGEYFKYVDGQLTSNGQTPVVASVTGNNGTIAGIPAGYTVVIKDLLADTDFFVEEIRLPEGWELENKEVEVDSCNPSSMTGTDFAGDTIEADGTIKLDTDAQVTFTNKCEQRLVAKKVWKSGSYVTKHGDIQVALFTQGEDGNLTYVDGTLRTIAEPETTVEYRVANLENLTVREVTVADGVVTPVDADESIVVSGETTEVGDGAEDSYVVSYKQGTADNGSRTDTITNTMPTLTVNKTDLDGAQLEGATFSLLMKNKQEAVPGYESFTSSDAEDGNLLSDVRLSDGVYYLVEIEAPAGYTTLEHMLKIIVDADGVRMCSDTDDAPRVYENVSTEKHTYTFNVANNPGYVLPSTGGAGTAGIYVAGSALALGAGSALVLRRRRR